MDTKKILGKKIQEYRKRAKLTQEQLAEIIGMDTISLSKIETGRNYPTSDNLSKIAEVLKVKVYELFVDDNLKSNEELLGQINAMLADISADNKKLHVVYSTLLSL